MTKTRPWLQLEICGQGHAFCEKGFASCIGRYDELVDLQNGGLDIGVVGGGVDALGGKILHNIGFLLRPIPRAEKLLGGLSLNSQLFQLTFALPMHIMKMIEPSTLRRASACGPWRDFFILFGGLHMKSLKPPLTYREQVLHF